MTFAQRRNRLTAHFSERIAVFKRRISVLHWSIHKQAPNSSFTKPLFAMDCNTATHITCKDLFWVHLQVSHFYHSGIKPPPPTQMWFSELILEQRIIQNLDFTSAATQTGTPLYIGPTSRQFSWPTSLLQMHHSQAHKPFIFTRNKAKCNLFFPSILLLYPTDFTLCI